LPGGRLAEVPLQYHASYNTTYGVCATRRTHQQEKQPNGGTGKEDQDLIESSLRPFRTQRGARKAGVRGGSRLRLWMHSKGKVCAGTCDRLATEGETKHQHSISVQHPAADSNQHTAAASASAPAQHSTYSTYSTYSTSEALWTWYKSYCTDVLQHQNAGGARGASAGAVVCLPRTGSVRRCTSMALYGAL
jgi:hypothetical protein